MPPLGPGASCDGIHLSPALEQLASVHWLISLQCADFLHGLCGSSRAGPLCLPFWWGVVGGGPMISRRQHCNRYSLSPHTFLLPRIQSISQTHNHTYQQGEAACSANGAGTAQQTAGGPDPTTGHRQPGGPDPTVEMCNGFKRVSDVVIPNSNGMVTAKTNTDCYALGWNRCQNMLSMMPLYDHINAASDPGAA
jgi:hypothetical protein